MISKRMTMDLQLITSLQRLCHRSVLDTWYLRTPRETKKCSLFWYKNSNGGHINEYCPGMSLRFCVHMSTFRSSSKLIIQPEKNKDRDERNRVLWTRTWVCTPEPTKKDGCCDTHLQSQSWESGDKRPTQAC